MSRMGRRMSAFIVATRWAVTAVSDGAGCLIACFGVLGAGAVRDL